MQLSKYLITMPLLLGLTACAWVKLDETGEKIRVLNEEEVSKCEYKGKSTVSVTDKVVGVRRHENAIREELLILARNGAKNLNGDTIVPIGEEAEGKQSFKVYRCVPR
jgi:hypothetical protein